MSYADIAIWSIAILIVLVTFLNPGGLVIGIIVAALLLGGRYGLPYLGQLYRDRQTGASAAKIQQGTRRRIRGGGKD